MNDIISILQNRLDAVNIDIIVEFILSCMNFDGGFGVSPGSESHAGQVRSHDSVLILVTTIHIRYTVV